MGPSPPRNSSSLATFSIVLSSDLPSDEEAELYNLSSVAVYQSTENYLVMINIDPANNLQAKPHVNSNLLANFSGFPQSTSAVVTKTATSVAPTRLSSIVTDPSVIPETIIASSLPTSIPPSIPQVISPPNGIIPSAPQDASLIQVGFFYELSYDFVVQHDLSVDQIFTFLPEGIAYGLNIPVDQVIMQTLRPLNTIHNLSYITTLAFAYIPQASVTPLGEAIQDGTSPLYHNPDNSVESLMNVINPSISLQPSSPLNSFEPLPFDNSSEFVGVGFAVTYNAPSSSNSTTTYARVSVGDGSGPPVTSVRDYVWHYNFGNTLEPTQLDPPNPSKNHLTIP